MKKLLYSIFLSLALCASTFAGTGDVRLITVNADGTYTELPITFTANGLLSFGSSAGQVTSVSSTNYATTASLSSYALASSVPTIRAGTVSVTAALTKAVTFSTPFPAGTTYVVTVITNGLATSGYAASMTVSGFTLTLPIAITGNISYIATPVQ